MDFDPRLLLEFAKKTGELGARLQGLAFELEHQLEQAGAYAFRGSSPQPSSRKKLRLKRRIFDRYAHGLKCVRELPAAFDSSQFGQLFRDTAPKEYEEIFDPARIKKILAKLCDDNFIHLIQPGAGRRPARYKIKVPRRERARG